MMTSRASSGVVAVIDKVVDLWHSISYSAYLVTEGRRRNVRRSGGSKVGRHFPRLCHPSGPRNGSRMSHPVAAALPRP